MNVATLVQQQAHELPQQPALSDMRGGVSRRRTFPELELDSSRMARMFADAGLRAGDVVLVFHPMSIELYVALVALFRLGLVAMFIDPSAGRSHIERCCDLIAPRAFLASQKAHLLRLVSPALAAIPRRFAFGWMPGAINLANYQRVAPLSQIVVCADESPALMTCTSGSTAAPKCAVRSHGFLRAQHMVLAKSMHLQACEIDMPTLPIFVLANLASGVTSVIADADLTRPGRIAAAPVIAQIQSCNVERITAAPALLERLVDYCETHNLTLPQLKQISVGGAPVFPNLLARLSTISPNARICAVYGSTEAEPIAHVDYAAISSSDTRAMFAGAGLLAGTPIPEISLRIIRNQSGTPLSKVEHSVFDSWQLDSGQVGEIVVSGNHVLTGYLAGRGDQETKICVDGQIWHRTGDAGYLDVDGRLWLLGRCSAWVCDDRGTLFPFAVECAAQSYSGVRRAALTTYADRRLLCLEADQTFSLPDLARLRRDLNWAHLDAVKIYPALPVDRRHNAKIDYPALHQLLKKEPF
jgi:acyl-CoA synthetase (AMP-forming)/AMP-acid ligase II